MATLVALLVMVQSPASSVPIKPPVAKAQAGPNTEMTMSGTGPGQGVAGFIARPSSTFNPLNGYPTQNPGADFTPKNEGFAGVIKGTFVNNGPTLSFYCIDIDTVTYNGIGYEHGTWDESNVPHVGYVARILDEYYPNNPTAPAGLTTSQQAAAVQAAIWYFSDRYVLSVSDPLHDVAAAIANHVIAQGPEVEPPPPTLSIDPNVARGPAGQTVGPFVVNSGTVTATVTSTGAQMFADPQATQPIAQGATVPSGQFIWLRSASPGTATLKATAVTTYPSGNVYLYDGNDPALSAAQKLILSKQETVSTTVSALAVFLAPGTLTVTKHITGPAAGSQGPVTIHVDCGTAAGTLPDFVIPGGARGNRSRDYPGLPAGAVCTMTETVDGHTSAIAVEVVGSGQRVTVPDDGVATAEITDTYTAVPGSLVVSKTITGVAAGDQGVVSIAVTCNDGVNRAPFVIPAGAPAGTTSKTYTQIPGGTTCTINETVNGANQATTVTVTGNNQQIAVPPGGTATANPIRDDYHHAPGSLTVTKVIAGAAAGQQGPITITVTCDGVVQQPLFQIAAGATGTSSQTYAGIPTPATCTAVEDPDGHTDTVTVTKEDSGSPVTVPPGGAPVLTLTDTYTRVPGDLVVNKTITGGAAGRQAEIRIGVVCDDGVTRPDFVIPPGAGAGTEQTTYSGIPNGTTCTVTETADGGSAAVNVTTVGSPQDVIIPVGGSATANITDAYEVAPGQLTVTKTIAGDGAGQQDPVRIEVTCGSQVLDPVFDVPAGTTGSLSRTYTGIPGGTDCTVVESQDGRNTVVDVTVEGAPQEVTVPAGGAVTAEVTDTYAPRAGSLEVRKNISGEAAPLRGEIRIEVDCDDGVARDPFVISPAPRRSGDEFRIYTDIPAGTTCTVTETADGSNNAALVTVTGNGQQVTVGAAESAAVEVTDVYAFAPGDLVVGKRISGPAAGLQGRIVLRPVCDGVALEPFVIPAGTPAGLVTHTYPGVAAGALCTGTEVPNGSRGSIVPVIDVVGPLPKRVPPGASTRALVNDDFTAAHSAIKVHKTIKGPQAGEQGEIVITTTCGTTTLPPLVIPAGAPAGSTSRTYKGLTPGTACTVRETSDGHTEALAVHASGDGQKSSFP